MGRTYAQGAGAVAFAIGFVLGACTVYHKTKLHLRLSTKEAEYLLDALDVWIDGYKDTAGVAEDEEIQGLYDSMAVAIDVRQRLWKELNDRGSTSTV